MQYTAHYLSANGCLLKQGPTTNPRPESIRHSLLTCLDSAPRSTDNSNIIPGSSGPSLVVGPPMISNTIVCDCGGGTLSYALLAATQANTHNGRGVSASLTLSRLFFFGLLIRFLHSAPSCTLVRFSGGRHTCDSLAARRRARCLPPARLRIAIASSTTTPHRCPCFAMDSPAVEQCG